jgi:hypothetical protein
MIFSSRSVASVIPSCAMPGDSVPAEAGVRLAELVAPFSLAIDLDIGQPNRRAASASWSILRRRHLPVAAFASMYPADFHHAQVVFLPDGGGGYGS